MSKFPGERRSPINFLDGAEKNYRENQSGLLRYWTLYTIRPMLGENRTWFTEFRGKGTVAAKGTWKPPNLHVGARKTPVKLVIPGKDRKGEKQKQTNKNPIKMV